jgi:hypothetical protein
MTRQTCQKLSAPSQDLKKVAPEYVTSVTPEASLFDERNKKYRLQSGAFIA